MNDFPDLLLRLGLVLAMLFLWAIVLGGGLALLHLLVSLPMRRAERARALLDLMETSLRLGEPVEPALISISLSREQSLGVRFHLFVAWLEKGLRLDEALAKVPRLLPPQIVAMLQAGQRIGDLRKILPACRQLLADAVSETRSALNYLVVITFVVSPATMFVFSILAIMVFPKLNEVAYGLGMDHSGGIHWLIRHSTLFVGTQIIFQLGMWLAAIIYVIGPHAHAWLPGYDQLSWRLPWRRKRMQRDFSIMLATLLDARMPEPEAITLAADCTANRCFQQRAAAAVHDLRQGHPLTEAVQGMDDHGEFRWRLTNAAHSRNGFLAALAGWHDALNAKAFQQQQAAAQVISTALLLFNGAFVAAIVITVFAFLISIINAGCLW
ncbi:MAG: type II secretion system F family protein [Verrucomicrobiota bacterium]|nr:type II secretion system F family protein [Limisphaerales bacterium]